MNRLALLGMLFVGSSAFADELKPEQLAELLRTILVPALPNPLSETKDGWDRQAETVVGMKWVQKGIFRVPEPIKKLHNDGMWRKIIVTSPEPEKNVTIGIVRLDSAADGKRRFIADVRLPLRMTMEQQLWKGGVRLYSGETRARTTACLRMDCLAETRLDKRPDSIIPDVIFRLRILDAQLSYDDPTVEHTAGVGGDAAKLMGQAFLGFARTIRPSMERHLVEKANAAIVRAGDTREIRLGLSRLFTGP